jgi:hypothetical protein
VDFLGIMANLLLQYPLIYMETRVEVMLNKNSQRSQLKVLLEEKVYKDLFHLHSKM